MMIKSIYMIFMIMSGQTILYQFLYNPMIHDCGWVTISTHISPQGAQAAMNRHRDDAEADWEEEYTPEQRMTHPFGVNEDWRVLPTKLLE